MVKIAKYDIEAQIGSGSMGKVYRAIDPRIGRTVAIKVIQTSTLSDPEQREFMHSRLVREARSAGILSHTNIVTVYETCEEAGMAYIAMEFVNGPTLESLLAADAPLDRVTALKLMVQAAAALDYAHLRKIVHRDIKPSNIMVNEYGVAKIADFGIAKDLASSDLTQFGGTRVGTVLGTPSYMSPEQIQGQAVTGRTDQFSLAAVTFQCLTGQKPFNAETLTALLYKILFEEPPLVEQLSPDLPAGLNAVLRKGLAKVPADRYASCGEFVSAVGQVFEPSLSTPGRPVVSNRVPEPRIELPRPPVAPPRVPIPGPSWRPPAPPVAKPAWHTKILDRISASRMPEWTPWAIMGLSALLILAAILIHFLAGDSASVSGVQ